MDFSSLLEVFLPSGEMLSTTSLFTVVGLFFMYTFVGITAGFGGGLTTMPLITMILPVQMAAPISTTIGAATATYAVILDRKLVQWKSVLILVLSSFIGIPVGLYVLKNAPDYIMKGGLGVFLVIYAIYSWVGPKLPKVDKDWIALPCGFSAGALGAAFSTNGPPLVIYGILRDLAPSVFRGTLNAVFMINNITIISGLINNGIYTVNNLKVVVLAIPMMLLGWIIGNMVHKRIPKEKFKKLVYVLLIFSGIMLLKGALPAILKALS
jgi:uncharacterized membrane protein YfcA